jgi:hypothetical protein
MNDAHLQEVELCSAIHLALEQLEPSNLTLHRPVAVREAQGCSNGGTFLTETCRKALEFARAF